MSRAVKLLEFLSKPVKPKRERERGYAEPHISPRNSLKSPLLKQHHCHALCAFGASLCCFARRFVVWRVALSFGVLCECTSTRRMLLGALSGLRQTKFIEKDKVRSCVRAVPHLASLCANSPSPSPAHTHTRARARACVRACVRACAQFVCTRTMSIRFGGS